MKDKIKIVFQVLFIVAGFFILSNIPLYSAPPNVFAPIDANYVVTIPNPILTNEVLTTQLNTDLIASPSAKNLGSPTRFWDNIYGLLGRFSEVTTNTISATGTNQSISLNPTEHGKVLVGGDSIVVATKSSDLLITNPQAGQIYFNTASGSFRGYNGTEWGTITLVLPTSTPTPTPTATVQVLVVAGGGGGGGSAFPASGGGGGGGVIFNSAHIVTVQPYPITVGDGGNPDQNGGNSVFDYLIAIGGGHGGANVAGADGGSGGGGGFAPNRPGGSGIVGQRI